jgi:hypothetical protein
MPNYMGIALLACMFPCRMMEAQQAERVRFCDLIKDPGKFDGRAVTLSRLLKSGAA